MPMSAQDLHFVLILLKGRTDRIGRRGSKGRSDRYLAGCAITVTVVIYAVLYVALDILDMLFASASAFVFHIVISFCRSDNSSITETVSFILLGKGLFMAIYTIADLHLSINDQTNKSMEVFGARWNGYVEKLQAHWLSTITNDDTVIIPGDISWALTLEEARQDLCFLNSLPGKKLIGKGNHDFWWSTATKIGAFFNQNHIDTISLLHNNAYRVEDKIICGTRGWFTDDSQQLTVSETDYAKIINREVIRLELSLKQGMAMRNPEAPEEMLVFLHFPPIWGNFTCPEILDTLAKYGIKNCYFGHIHGGYNLPGVLYYEDMRFVRISADHLSFLPYPIK